MKSLNKKEQFVELRASGLSFNQISEALDISKQTAINWSKELEFEIANLAQLRKDSLREKYALSIEQSLENSKILLEKVRAKILETDLGDMSLKDLLALQDSIENKIRREMEPVFRKSDFGIPSLNSISEWSV